jgi:hypothetical protein
LFLGCNTTALTGTATGADDPVTVALDYAEARGPVPVDVCR